jgi:hypothetical protein
MPDEFFDRLKQRPKPKKDGFIYIEDDEKIEIEASNEATIN